MTDYGGADVTFSASRFVLLGLAEKAGAVVPSRDFQPILKNFLVQISPGRLQMIGTDLELTVQVSSPSVTTSGEALLAMPAKRLQAILREAPEGDVTVRVAGNVARVTAQQAHWDLLLPSPADYPALPDPGVLLDSTYVAARSDLLVALQSVRHAMGRDAGRPAMTMVSIDGGKVVACDGVRYQQAALPGSLPAMHIPAAAVDHLLKILSVSEAKDVRVASADTYLVFAVGASVFLASKLIARFPDTEKLMLTPALANKEQLVVSRADLAAAVRRVRINSDAETSAVGLQLSAGALTVSSTDKNHNGAQERITAEWRGADRMVVVNHKFLTEMLAVWPQPSCRFFLGPDTARRKSLVMLRDEKTGMVGIISQMNASLLGFG